MQLETYYETPDHKVKLYCGHVLEVLGAMSPESVHCVVTSPPYHWSLRKYDCEPVIWGGDPNCPHSLEPGAPIPSRGYVGEKSTLQGSTVSMEQSKGVAGGYTGKARWQHDGVSRQETPDAWVKTSYNPHPGQVPDSKHPPSEAQMAQGREHESATCRLCGAWRGQYGLEPTPELYVEHTMMWLREVKRVLRKDGTLWLNIGDGYCGTGDKGEWKDPKYPDGRNAQSKALNRKIVGLKAKDAVLMPFRVALAAQMDGWWVRSVIIWAKPNPMPESCKDRPARSHEYIFLLTRSKNYWYDADAVREPHTDQSVARYFRNSSYDEAGSDKPYAMKQGPTGHGMKQKWDTDGSPTWVKGHSGYVNADGHVMVNQNGRNCRSVWTFPTQGFPDAHFAVFPRELPERCIKAGCPEWVCPKCGKARVRVTENTPMKIRRTDWGELAGNRTAPSGTMVAPAESTTTGWTDCGCGAGFVGGVVLDPFAGSGTTCEVAYHLGRTAIGVDASAKYLDMAIGRVKQGALL